MFWSLLHQAQLHQQLSDVEQYRELVEHCSKMPFKKGLKHLGTSLKLRFKVKKLPLEQLKDDDLPLSFFATDGRSGLLAKRNEEQSLVLWAGEKQPAILTNEQLEQLWQGQVVYLVIKGTDSKFDISWFIPAFKRFKPLLIEVLIFSFFMQLLALITPLFFQVVMDKVLVSQRMSTLDVLIIGIACAGVFEIILKGLREYQLAHTCNRVDLALGEKLFNHIMHLPLPFFQARSVGIIVMRIRELSSIREFITGAGLTLIIDLGFTVIFLAVMYYFSPLLTLIVLGSIPCYALLCWVMTGPLQRRTEAMFGHGAVNNAFLTESVSMVETCKSLSIEPQLQRRWEGQINRYLGANVDLQFLTNIYSQGVQLIQKVTVVLVLWFGANAVIALELSIGQLIAFNMMVGHVTQPIVRLADLWQQFVQAQISVDRLGDVLNTPSELNDNKGLPPPLIGNIDFHQVSFRYQPDQPPVINGLNLSIKAGQVIGIVGPSGSGKSTLAKLLQGLYHPQQGAIILDGHNLNTWQSSAFRQQTGVVLQENYLFNRSVRDNIALGEPEAALSKVIEAAKLAGAHEFILGLSDGYDTILAEGGLSLSGGQRQRVAIARALLSSPKLLILDEATSALDDVSQQQIQQNMAKICRDKTVVIIAHRLSTVRDCDRIITLENGIITSDGSHEQLLRQGSCYANLWALQQNMQDDSQL